MIALLSLLAIFLLPLCVRAYATPTGGVGYRGWVKVGSLMVPVRRCDIEQTPNPIVGEDLIHGSANEPDAASIKNWAEGRYEYAGGFETDLFADFWSTLMDWAVSDRHTPQTVVFSPNNQDTYTYSDVYVNSLTINGNLRGAITITVDVRAKTRTSSGTVGTYSSFALNKAPIPYWKSSFVGTNWGTGDWASFGNADSDLQVTAWSITINNNTIVEFTFDGTKDPHYVQQGMMMVNGSITVFDENGIPAPSDGGSVTITIADAGTITLPYIVITGYPMPTAAPSAKVVRTVNFRSLGTDADPCVKIS